MDTEHVHQSIVIAFALFCASGGRFVDLGLSAEQLVCLFNECLEVAKYHNDDMFCLLVCTLAAEKSKELGNNDNVLVYAKEMLKYVGKLGSVVRERYEVCRWLIVRSGIVSHDPKSKTVLVAIAAILAESIGLKAGEHAANRLFVSAYKSLNQYEDAIPCIQRMNDIAIEMNDNRALARGYLWFLDIYHILDQYDQVMIYANKYIDLAKKIKLNDGLSRAYRLLINSCRILPPHDHVIKYTREYFDVAQTIRVHPERSQEENSVFVLADLLDNPEQYDDAVIDRQKCYKISIKVDANVCWIISNLGEAYLGFQDVEKTLFYCEQAIKLVKQCGNETLEGINSTVLQRALYIAGLAYLLKSHYAKAHDYFTKSLKIALELKDSANIALLSWYISIVNAWVGVCNLCPPNSSELPEIILNKNGMVTEESMDDFEFNQFQELLEISRKHELDKEYELAISCHKKLESLIENSQFGKYFYIVIRIDIARLNFLLHRLDTALRLFREICKETQMNGYKEQEARCQHMISSIYFARRELANAESYARKSVECLEKVFDLQRRNEEYQIAIVEKYIQYYDFLTAILIMSNQNIEALETVDCYRARALKTQLIMNYHMDHDIQEKPIQYSDIQSLVSKSQCTIVQYFVCRRSFIRYLCTFVVPCDNEDTLIRHQPNFSFDDIEKFIEWACSEMNLRLMNCEDRSLGNNTETDDGQRTRQDDLREDAFEVKVLRTLPSQEETQPETGHESSFNSALEFLYSKLIQNVISDVEADEIVFIPDGPLFKVPFAALRDPETGLYLSETKRIRIAPSISTLKILSDRPADFESKSNALIVGDPSVGKVMFNGKETEFPPLLFSYVEAVTVSRVLGGQTLLRHRATKAAVLEKLQQGVSVVHIAAHGDGKKGTIALAPSPNASKIPEEDDYMLTMADVQKANVRAKLVVLSCCHSGRGEIKAEGVVGMCRAFLASGARAVVASLWGIDDEATLEFMKVFYGNLKEKKSASLSLQLAMKHMMKHKEFSEPKYWAPFFLMGDDVTIF